MARTRALLRALATVARRSDQSFLSFSANNIYYGGFTLLFLRDPQAFAVSVTIIMMVLFLPLSAGPLRQIPAERLLTWPLTGRDELVIRAARVALNPVAWIIAALLFWTGLSLSVWIVLALCFAIGFTAPRLHLSDRIVANLPMPSFPVRLNQLIRKNLRELSSTLDFYSAAIFSVAAAIGRAFGLLPAEAFLPCTVVIMLLMSSCALSLFALEGMGGFARYRLLPLAGWEILAAKDAAFGIICLTLTVALSPLGGLAAGLAALAVGHTRSVRRQTTDRRWRFQTSDSFVSGISQMVLMAFAAIAAVKWHPVSMVGCLVLCLFSLRRAARLLEDRLALSTE